MKIIRKDKVIVIAGRDKGKTGEVVLAKPATKQVVVQGVNISKKHVKPSQSNPKGGIVEVTKPIDVSKVMVLDPASGKPARVGYKMAENGKKQRIFKVSKFSNPKASKDSKSSTAKGKKE